MTHEPTEANLIENEVDQDVAHELAGQTHPTFGNHDPEVIQQFPAYFKLQLARIPGYPVTFVDPLGAGHPS
jgi:hypothetical protein